MDDRERALLDAIWAEPEAREPRRVYADFLLARGDLRGECMAIRLDRAADDALQARATTLETQHGGKWLGAARPFVRTWQFDFAGMVARVRCEADKLIAGFDHIVALGPRLAIVVTSMRTKKRQTVARIAALELARVYELRLANNGLDDKDIAALAPGLRCKRVDLANNRYGPAGLHALEPHVAHMERIHLGLWTDEAKSAVTFRDLEVPFAAIPNIAAKLAFEQPAGAVAYRC